MELRHLRYFVAVAEELHFGRAAKRLGIAQPPLSRQIQVLETELEVQLFDQSRRRVELSPAGIAFLGHARGVFEAIELAAREAKRASVGQSGRIAVGYFGLARLQRSHQVIARFSGALSGDRGDAP